MSLPVMAAQAPPSSNQSSVKTWVGRYQEFEEYLRTAECVSMQTLEPMKAGRCTLPPGGPIARMAWRSPDGPIRGFHERYKTEIAAYELDKLLKLDMVPPSVERRIQGNTGAAQQWVEDVLSVRADESPDGPYRAEWENQLARMTMYDNLIGNRDRSFGNMIRDANWNLILLDHSRAFGTGTDLPRKMTRIDSGFWKRIENLTQKQLDSALRKWIDESATRAILDRRERMRAEIKLLAR
ncbi:MAG TPA: hypothetical protein VH740_17580 [Vicinamibacterales bacterium]